MKNKININSIMIAITMFCVMAVSIFMFCGGVRGKSAYQLACENGFKGTESEWLNSLKGTNGKDAETIDYLALYNSAKQDGEINNEVTYLQFIQNYIVNNAQSSEKSLLYAIQDSIKCSVGIVVSSSAGVSAGAGTIFDIDSNGNATIVTNYHVTYTSALDREIYILLYEDSYLSNRYSGTDTFVQTLKTNKKVIKATYVGGSKNHDLAVLKISGSDRLKERYNAKAVDKVTIADASTDLYAGSDCYAIGNPFGEGISASQGIVSVPYEIINTEDVENSSNEKGISMRVVRTTCNINGGNSGGGLFNAQGQLIGVINSKRYYANSVDDTIAEGTSFAIPLPVVENVVYKIINDCENSTKTTPSFKQIGITYKIDDCVASFNPATGLTSLTETISISSITPFSYADKAGLKEGDKLVSASVAYKNGKSSGIMQINHYYTLSDLMLSVSAGDKVTLTVSRVIEYVGARNISVTITF